VSVPTVSAIVVTHDGVDHVGACLRSLAEFAPDAEVVVVDNASRDGTPDAVRSAAPRARLLENPGNRGFAAACRDGVVASAGRFFLLLNQDAMLAAPLAPLAAALDADDGLAAIGGRVTYPDGRLQATIGHPWTPTRLALSWLVPARVPVLGAACARVETSARGYGRARADVPWVSGAFLLGRRRVWDELGGFDPAYFMYVEDVDYADRARRAGHRVGYSPAGRAVHAERGATGLREDALRWTVEGSVRLLGRTHGDAAAARFRRSLARILRADAVAAGLVARLSGSARRRAQAAVFGRVGRELAS